MPTIVTPVIGDQVYHSIWVQKLGAGIATSLLAKLSAKEFADALTTATQDENMRRRAKEVGEEMHGEDGCAEAVSVVAEQLALIAQDPSSEAASGLHLREAGRNWWCCPWRPSADTERLLAE